MTKLLIESNEEGLKGNLYMEGTPEEITRAIVMAMSSSPLAAQMIIAAEGYFRIIKKKGLFTAKDIVIETDDEAERLFKELFSKKKGGV